MKKKLKQFFLYLIVLAGVTVAVPVVLLSFFQDDVIQQFITEANKRIRTPVKIRKVDISVWHNFPNIGIVFHDVYVEDSYEKKSPLITAKSISFYIDPVAFWQGQYTVSGLEIDQGQIDLKVSNGRGNNYTVLQEATTSDSFISIDLENIRLVETGFSYQNESSGNYYYLNSDALRVSIAASSWYEILAEGDITTNQIKIQSGTLLRNKNFRAKIALRYDREHDHLFIQPSILTLYQSQFEVKGEYTAKEVNITCKGKNTTIQTLLSFFPRKLNTRLAKYKSNGNVYFNLVLKGQTDQGRSPSLMINFGLSKATLFHPDYTSEMKKVDLDGSFAMPSITNLSSASMSLKNIHGELNGHLFEGGIDIQNFDDPYVKFDFRGNFDVPSLVNFYPLEEVSNVTGNIGADVSFEGRIKLLKNKNNIGQVITSGTIAMQDLNFEYGEHQSHVENLNGLLRFTNNDLMLEDVRGQLQDTDFHIDGAFKNIVTFLVFEDQPIGIEATVKSKFMDLNQLFTIGFTHGENANYSFFISPNLYLNFNYDVEALHYKRFKPTHLKGNLLIKNQAAMLRNITFDALGGSFMLNSIVDAKNNKAIDVMSYFTLKGIDIDSTFYVFKNFQQDFIKDENLKGRAFVNMDLEMVLSEKLTLFPNTLFANMDFTIKGGELNNFKPLQKLKKYMPDDVLNHLYFADLTNHILVKNRTINIPSMKIKSNATTIDIRGTHTFDQNINYRLVVPLRSKKKPDSDEEFGKVEEVQVSKSKLFLKIVGTAEKYKVMYDKEEVKKKIQSDIKRELGELKEAFKLKGKQEKKKLEIEKGAYFDWDDTTTTKDQ